MVQSEIYLAAALKITQKRCPHIHVDPNGKWIHLLLKVPVLIPGKKFEREMI